MKLKNTKNPVVGILMGSDTDWPTMKAAAEVCKEFGLAHEVKVISAHRTPQDLSRFASNAHKRGMRVIIAGGRRGRASAGRDCRLHPVTSDWRAHIRKGP
jgi:5-(carboxyamino)imidazole ribonucleotide mutase